MKRKDILDRAAKPEDRIVLARVLDKIESVVRGHEVEVTDFYDPYQQGLISPVLSKAPGISFVWAGGYENAERRRLILAPEYMETEDGDNDLSYLEVTGNVKFQNLTHRDFLGSIMALGIKREKMGDIIVTPTGCQLITDRQIADYITRNLTKVHKVGVQVREIGPESLNLPKETNKEIFATVQSLRLDAVAAAGYGTSRSKMAAEIAAEKVRVNWIPVTDCSYLVKERDKISIRGRGRVEIETVKGETKKGRIALVIKRFQ